MDRKHCILFYSIFSAASKRLIEYIESLPYDLPKVTGMTMLCVDSPVVRSIVNKHGIDVVPLLFIQYFDGETQLLTDKLINDWILEVSHVMSPSSSPPLDSSSPSSPSSVTMLQLPSTRVEDTTDNNPMQQTAPVDRKIDVMSMAMSMQKKREAVDSKFDRKKQV